MRTVLILLTTLLFSGCATTNVPREADITPKTTVVKIYPELPQIKIPDGPKIYNFKFDIPRDKSKLVVKNLSSCINVPEEKRDEEFWKRCGENPPVVDSNIFLGLDQENFNNLMLTLESMREYIIILKKTIEEINKQRQEWSRLNKENLDKLN